MILVLQFFGLISFRCNQNSKIDYLSEFVFNLVKIKGGPKINLSVTKLLPTLEKMLKLKYKLLNVHRLDADTTGVMLFAM